MLAKQGEEAQRAEHMVECLWAMREGTSKRVKRNFTRGKLQREERQETAREKTFEATKVTASEPELMSTKATVVMFGESPKI